MESAVWTTLGTTCGRCQAGLEILVVDLSMWSLVGQQEWKKQHVMVHKRHKHNSYCIILAIMKNTWSTLTIIIEQTPERCEICIRSSALSLRWEQTRVAGHTGGLINPRPWQRRCPSGYSNTGGPPLPRKRVSLRRKCQTFAICCKIDNHLYRNNI